MKLAIGYITGRSEPKLDWVMNALEQQAQPEDELTLIVVDALARPAVSIGFQPIRAVVDLIEVSPKPNPWQGTRRITSRECWAMSNARNTAFVWCPEDVDYIAFLDDRCELGPNWLATVRAGYLQRTSVICGAYEKLEDDGRVATDNRRVAAPRGKADCGGNWLYGCTFALPLEWALDVNGFEEGCDGMSFEDVIFGLNLAHAGYRIDYRPEMFVRQHRGSAQANTFYRTDKGVSPNDKSHAALARFGVRKRTEFTLDLREIRLRLLDGDGEAAWPKIDPGLRDWFDGQLVREV